MGVWGVFIYLFSIVTVKEGSQAELHISAKRAATLSQNALMPYTTQM